MKIFFTASYPGKEQYQKYYDKIVEVLKGIDAEIVSPELNNYKQLLTPNQISQSKDFNELHYKAIKAGIEWADLVIIEISQEDFQLGHEATLAVLNKKPVLALSIREDYSLKIKNKHFFGAKYKMFNVKPIILDFIEKNRKEPLNERFNLFLSPKQLHYLQEASRSSDINMSEYIRQLINSEMEQINRAAPQSE